MAFKEKWLPHAEATEENLAIALYLEQHEQKRFEVGIANGIAKAFEGD